MALSLSLFLLFKKPMLEASPTGPVTLGVYYEERVDKQGMCCHRELYLRTCETCSPLSTLAVSLLIIALVNYTYYNVEEKRNEVLRMINK